MDLFLCRDLDSSMTRRESLAVGEFLSQSEMSVHVMRDHPAHNTAIMAGMWGARIDGLRKHFDMAFRNMKKVARENGRKLAVVEHF